MRLPLSDEANAFLALSTRPDLAAWLGITDRRLRYLLYKIPPSGKYKTFSIKKRTGALRSIDAPNNALKQLQRKLLAVVSELAPPSGVAKGYVKGRSTIDHARVHRRSKWVVLADLQDFFPSINFGRVRGAFMARPFNFPADVATCLAQLCCKDGALPQGAPTSPAISNLVCRALDRALVKLATDCGCRVSRYADDICISTNHAVLPSQIAVSRAVEGFFAGGALDALVRAQGFTLNQKKFRVIKRDSRQLVTGLVVNKGISLSRDWRRQVRVLLHLTQTHGEEKALEIARAWDKNPLRRAAGTDSIEQILRGKIYYSHMIDRLAHRSFVPSLYRSYPRLRNLMPNLAKTVSMRIMAEGATDLLHIESALRSLQSNGHFNRLKPRFKNFKGDTGDVELAETLLRLAKSDISELTIGVFDCDNPVLMKKKALEVGSYTRLGDMVFALCLAPPDGVSEPFCIESLYDRAEACRLTGDGRRLFFGDEFDESTGLDGSGAYRREHPKKKAVVLSDKVTRLSDGESVLLSKMEFAGLVSSGAAPFSQVDYAGFVPTFRLLDEVVDVVYGDKS